jgi:phage tail tube protein FII
MVKVAMGVDDVDTAQIVFGQGHQYLVHISPRIDDRCLSRSFTAKDIAV